jgi:two-component system chemotaxis response regulator CheY
MNTIFNYNSRILVVDDSADIRKVIVMHLKELNYQGEILQAEDVDQAILILQKYNAAQSDCTVQFIVSDWNMPGKSGLDFLKWVRSNILIKHLPFLMITTESEKAKIFDAMIHGVNDFIIKPWKKESIQQKLLKLHKA